MSQAEYAVARQHLKSAAMQIAPTKAEVLT